MISSPDPRPDSPTPYVLELARLDCELLAVLTSTRLRDPIAEQRRTALLDGVHRAAREAARRLEEYSRHAVTECHGSRSRWNVAADARAFYDALAAYAALARWTAEELAGLAAEDAGARAGDDHHHGGPEGQARGRLHVL